MDATRASPLLAPGIPAPPEALVRETWVLDPPAPSERRDVDRPEAAALVDGLLARVARGQGALDVAIGELLAELSKGNRLLRLGWSCLGDYARERLDLGETAARNLVKLARGLCDRPRLREAVRSGEVSARKAQAIVRVAVGDDEAAWVARARTDTVRALEAAVRSARAGGALEAHADDEPWERIQLQMTVEQRAKLDEAMALAGKVLGAASPQWQRLEAVCQEYLGACPSEPTEDEALRPEVLTGPVAEWLEGAKEGLEQEMNRWDFLERVPETPAPVGGIEDHHGLRALDERVRELASMRGRWGVLLGHLAMLTKNVGLWRDAGFASFSHYCEERLGLAARTVEQRAALARRCYWVPDVREAMKDGRLPYEKARLVARVADERTMRDWIGRAQMMTVLELRREVEALDGAQKCARGELDLRVPRGVRILVDAVVRAVRERGSGFERAGECLAVAAEHFIGVWRGAIPRRATLARKALDRDRGFCTAPGCSRPAVHAHHVVYRSAGGEDDLANLTSLCASHHLHAVHLGWVRVTGDAPGGLFWEMAAPPGGWLT